MDQRGGPLWQKGPTVIGDQIDRSGLGATSLAAESGQQLRKCQVTEPGHEQLDRWHDGTITAEPTKDED